MLRRRAELAEVAVVRDDVTAVGWPTVAVAGTVSVGKFGSLLLMVSVVVRVPPVVGVKSDLEGEAEVVADCDGESARRLQ